MPAPDFQTSCKELSEELYTLGEAFHAQLAEIARAGYVGIYNDKTNPFYRVADEFYWFKRGLAGHMEMIEHTHYDAIDNMWRLKEMHGAIQDFVQKIAQFPSQLANKLKPVERRYLFQLVKEGIKYKVAGDNIALTIMRHEILPAFDVNPPRGSFDLEDECTRLESIINTRFDAITRVTDILARGMKVKPEDRNSNNWPFGIIASTHADIQKYFSVALGDWSYPETIKRQLPHIVNAIEKMFAGLPSDYVTRLELDSMPLMLECYEFCINSLGELKKAEGEIKRILNGRMAETAEYKLPADIRTLPAIVTHFREMTLNPLNEIAESMRNIKHYMPANAQGETGMYGAAYKALIEVHSAVKNHFAKAETFANRQQKNEMHAEMRAAAKEMGANLRKAIANFNDLRRASQEEARRMHAGALTNPFKEMEKKYAGIKEGQQAMAAFFGTSPGTGQGFGVRK